jgi:hypothetical protein
LFQSSRKIRRTNCLFSEDISPAPLAQDCIDPISFSYKKRPSTRINSSETTRSEPSGDALRERELRRNFAAVLGLTQLRHGEGEGRPGRIAGMQ